MSNKVIGDYTAAATIDGSTNYLLIQPGNSSTAYNKINRNVFLGVTGQPMDTSTAQSISNKTLGNTNTITVKDTALTIQDNSDTTKQAVFELSGLTTATTRTYTLPDRSSTIATLGGAQTFTGANSFTGSSWSGGSIDNATITVDSIAGHTSSTSGTIYGLSISSSKIGSNGIITASITDGAVTPAKLQSGTGSTWSWQSWTPTLTNMSGGTINYAKYNQVGKIVNFRFKYTLAGAGISGSVSFTLPVTANADYSADVDSPFGVVSFVDSGTQRYAGIITFGSTTTGVFHPSTVSGSNVITSTNISSTTPFTWGAADYIIVNGTYEAA